MVDRTIYLFTQMGHRALSFLGGPTGLCFLNNIITGDVLDHKETASKPGFFYFLTKTRMKNATRQTIAAG